MRLFVFLILIKWINSEGYSDPELSVDTSNWIDPNDPFQLQYVDNIQHCKCDCINDLKIRDNVS